MSGKFVAVAAALGIFLGTGCNKSPEGGASSGGNTFTVKAPSTSTSVKQGEKKNIDLSIGHGKDFKDDITFEIMKDGLPKGLQASLEKSKVPATEEKLILIVEAAPDAVLGDAKVKVTGKPGTGNATSVDVPVKVEAK